VALGARTAGVVSLVVGQGLRMVISGLAVGLIASLYTNRLLSGLLFGTDPNDPFTLAAVSTLLLGVALVACLVPARRATAFDPAEVLRAE
jgi:putative ABC transport system permease protein